MADPSSSRFDALRLLLGFAVLPAVNALLAFFVHQLVWTRGPYGGVGDPIDAAISFAAGVTIVALLVTVVGAVPIVWWLRNQGRVSLRSIVTAAVALGNAPFAISVAGVVAFYLVGSATSADVGYVLWSGPMGIFRAIAIGSVMGFASGVVFWAVAIRGTAQSRPRSEAPGMLDAT